MRVYDKPAKPKRLSRYRSYLQLRLRRHANSASIQEEKCLGHSRPIASEGRTCLPIMLGIGGPRIRFTGVSAEGLSLC